MTRRWRIMAGLSAACLYAFSMPGAEERPRESDTVFRFATTAEMFSEVNESDARAAMKVWISTVAESVDIRVDDEFRVFSNTDEILEELQNKKLNGIAMTMEEYARLRNVAEVSRLALSVNGGTDTESYILLVHADSGIEDLVRLRGASICMLHNPRMSLASIWLDTLLMEHELPPSGQFLGRINRSSKPGQVVLPVFFRQADVCMTTLRSFNMMIELNPDVGRRLKIIAQSPDIIPSGFLFFSNVNNIPVKRILVAMNELGNTAAGQQILALTKSDSIREQPVDRLVPTMAMYDRYQELLTNFSRSGGH